MSKRLLGQATPVSHPHLFSSPTQITPSISSVEYQTRRQILMNKLNDNSTLIIPGQGLRYSTQGIFYPFHQQTSLFYLSGLLEPHSAMTLTKSKFTLFLQPYDQTNIIWDGPRAGLAGARDFFKADEAYPISQFEDNIKAMNGTFITDLPIDRKKGKGWLQGTHIVTKSRSNTHKEEMDADSDLLSIRLEKKCVKTGEIIDLLRWVKSDSEASLMRKAGQVGGRGFVKTMKRTKAGLSESDLAAEMEYHCKIQGATGLSYVPVIAGGSNALILHYIQNNQVLKDGALVLMDAGCEFGAYCSDITRTFPVNGVFSAPQRALYSLVLNVQKKIIKMVTIGSDLNELQRATFEMFKKELSILFERKVTSSELENLYPHHVSHYIGLDVHDTPSISRSKALVEGVCLTVEPGLYIPDEKVYGIFRGMGIRIEDCVMVSKHGAIILTVEAPKEIIDIENVMKKQP